MQHLHGVGEVTHLLWLVLDALARQDRACSTPIDLDGLHFVLILLENIHVGRGGLMPRGGESLVGRLALHLLGLRQSTHRVGLLLHDFLDYLDASRPRGHLALRLVLLWLLLRHLHPTALEVFPGEQIYRLLLCLSLYRIVMCALPPVRRAVQMLANRCVLILLHYFDAFRPPRVPLPVLAEPLVQL